MKKKSERENIWECLERLDINLVALYGEIRTLKGQAEALEVKFCKEEEFRLHCDNKLSNRIKALEEANKPPKTCGTCRYPIRFSFREYVCWRHNDGKTRYDVLGSTPACDKHKEIT